jgi:hypothetical protein
MNLEEQIALLNPQPGERFSANYKKGKGDIKSVVLTHHLIAEYVHSLPMDADIWIGVNPVDHTKVVPGGRGKSRDVTRLTALYADLDVKEGGCKDYGQAMEIIYGLADILGEEPTMIIHSGNGVQPYWAVDPDENRTNPELSAILTRWGALVRIVAKSVGAQGVDSVFDLSRILRCVGTRNNKRLHIDGYSAEVTGEIQTGGPMTLSQIVDRLDEYGVPDVEPGSEDDFTGQSDPAAWGFASTSCGYAKAAFEGWRTDMPARGRHPWMHGNAIRLEAFRRNGCLTGLDYDVANNVLRQRFEQFCVGGIGGDPRPVKAGEVDSSLKDARAYVAVMSDGRLLAEVGHLHDAEIFGVTTQHGPTNSVAPQGNLGGTTVDPEPGRPEDEEAPQPDGIHAAIFDAEEDFWDSRDSLKLIFEAALARVCSPWAVLAACAARALALVPPQVTTPAYTGGPGGSLNWFAAITSMAGGGKSSSMSLAKYLVAPPVSLGVGDPPTDQVCVKEVGSGEGMVNQFRQPSTKKGVPDRVRSSVMFTADEVDTLTAQGQRSGSTTLPMIRSAFGGEKLGYSYVSRDVHVEPGTYRMTLILGVQPARAAALFDDAGAGTPQRFMWFPATDSRISLEKANYRKTFHEIALPNHFADWLSYPMRDGYMLCPDEVGDFIVENLVKKGRGEVNALDTHANYARLKFAYALSILDGRKEMSVEDWRLSGIAAEVSRRTREWVQSKLDDSRVVEAKQQGRIRGISQHAANDAKAEEDSKKSERAQKHVLNWLSKHESGTLLEIRRPAKSDIRQWVEGAVNALASSMPPQIRLAAGGGGKWCLAE